MELNILVCGSIEQGGHCIPLVKNHCLAVKMNCSQVYWYTRTDLAPLRNLAIKVPAGALITCTMVSLKQNILTML